MAYSDEKIENIFDSICERIENGESLRKILKVKEMPSSRTFFKWLANDEQKVKQYALAIEYRSDVMFEEILEIADDTSNDTLINDEGIERPNSEWINRSRLRIDARKWMLSKMLPKKYGDKQETTHVFENPIFTGIELDVSKDNSTK
jgi:hypothetical protein